MIVVAMLGNVFASVRASSFLGPGGIIGPWLPLYNILFCAFLVIAIEAIRLGIVVRCYPSECHCLFWFAESAAVSNIECTCTRTYVDQLLFVMGCSLVALVSYLAMVSQLDEGLEAKVSGHDVLFHSRASLGHSS